jgi:hypothetical protein
LADFPTGSIAKRGCTPGKSAAHGFKDDEVAALDAPVADRDVER